MDTPEPSALPRCLQERSKIRARGPDEQGSRVARSTFGNRSSMAQEMMRVVIIRAMLNNKGSIEEGSCKRFLQEIT